MTIVVGVDGSGESIAALRFAIGEARLRGETVKAVIAWHLPTAAYGTGFTPSRLDLAEQEEAARGTLAEAIEAAAAGEEDGVPVEAVVREGEATHILIEESEGAAQLVVGCRNLNFVGRLLHHSISGHCSREAHCPVTVVHDG